MLPRAALVPVQFERRESEASSLDCGPQFGLQRTSFFLCHLVLNRDVGTRLMQVLIRQAAMEMVRDKRADFENCWRMEANGGALAKVHQPVDLGFGRREFAYDPGNKASEFIQQ